MIDNLIDWQSHWKVQHSYQQIRSESLLTMTHIWIICNFTLKCSHPPSYPDLAHIVITVSCRIFHCIVDVRWTLHLIWMTRSPIEELLSSSLQDGIQWNMISYQESGEQDIGHWSDLPCTPMLRYLQLISSSSQDRFSLCLMIQFQIKYCLASQICEISPGNHHIVFTIISAVYWARSPSSYSTHSELPILIYVIYFPSDVHYKQCISAGEWIT